MKEHHPDINDILREQGEDAARESHDQSRKYQGNANGHERKSNKTQDDRRKLFTLYRDLKTTSNKKHLVHNLLGAGEQSAIYGQPGSGKSVLVEDMALHVSAGWEWHGHKVTQGAVLGIALERRQLVERRAIAFRNKHDITDLPFAIAGGVHDFRDKRTAEHFVDVARQVEVATGNKVVLIYIDTLSRALCGGDENSPKDMGAIVAASGLLHAGTGAHVLWVHHMPIDSGERMRGHGALLGAMDTTIHIVKGDGIRTATVVKANDSEEGERVAFTLESVVVGTDEDGNDTTAPVVVPAERTPSTSRSNAKWPRGLKLVHDVVAAAVLDHGRDHRVAGDGPLVKAVPVQQVRALHNSRYVSNGDGNRVEAERKSWARNFKDAQNRKLVGGEAIGGEELIWLLRDEAAR